MPRTMKGMAFLRGAGENRSEDWWKDVMMGYDFLKSKGHEEIAVAGLSLGGVFSLKLGYTVPIKGIVTMCAPMYIKSEEMMFKEVLEYAREFKKYEGKTQEQIELEMDLLADKPMNTLKSPSGIDNGCTGARRSYLCSDICRAGPA